MWEDADKRKTDSLIEADVFVVNSHTHEVHHRNFQTAQCQISEIKAPIVTESLTEARRRYNADPCAHCFKSKR